MGTYFINGCYNTAAMMLAIDAMAGKYGRFDRTVDRGSEKYRFYSDAHRKKILRKRKIDKHNRKNSRN